MNMEKSVLKNDENNTGSFLEGCLTERKMILEQIYILWPECGADAAFMDEDQTLIKDGVKTEHYPVFGHDTVQKLIDYLEEK
jgi:hypothetical protein